jgi:hypothetical protein
MAMEQLPTTITPPHQLLTKLLITNPLKHNLITKLPIPLQLPL